MTRLAWRNLTRSPARLLISLGGVSVALVLMLALDAVFTGIERQVTAFIDHSRADVFVTQQGVRNMHMASTSLPQGLQPQFEAVAGVESVTPILYVTGVVVADGDPSLAYIVGLPPSSGAGGPWELTAGRGEPGRDGVVVDGGVAEKAGLEIGDEVEILGRDFEIVGLSRGTASLAGSVAFIDLRDFQQARRDDATVSLFLVRGAPGVEAEVLARRIEAALPEVAATTRPDFAAQERKVIRDMSTEVLAIMNMVGFLIGLAVMGLTVYTGTLSRRAEYGVLKALGARSRDLAGTVVTQSTINVALGFLVALLLTAGLAWMAPRLTSQLYLVIGFPSLVKVAVTSLTIAGLASLLPIRGIARLDPAAVFRKR